MSSAPSRERLIDLLRSGKEPSSEARVRIALDVLGELCAAVTVVPRSEQGPTLEAVLIAPDGRAALSAVGDLSGAALLVWEILAARPAEGSDPPRLHDVVDEVHPDVDELLERVLDADAEPMSAEELMSALASAGETVTAAHSQVVAQLLSHTPRRSTRRPPPPSTPTVAEEPPAHPAEDDSWDIPEAPAKAPTKKPPPVYAKTTPGGFAPFPPSTLEPAPAPAPRAEEEDDPTPFTWEDTVKKHAQERAAKVRESAARARAEQLEREKTERERREAQAAEEAKAEAERTKAQAEAAAESAHANEANMEALDDATATTARLLTGSLSDRDTSDIAPGTVLLIHGDDGGEASRLADAIEEAGFTLILRRDAISALDALAWVQPICIVCDYDLKDASGDSLARRLRKKGSEVALTPFLLLASPTDTRTGISRFAMGADVCMLKPYRPAEVVAQIRALVGMARRLRAARSALPRLESNRRTGFAGDLVQMSIAAVLTVLELEHRTGTFEVASDAGNVTLDVVGGALMRGTANGATMSPVGALRVMISRKTGKFSFKPGRVWPAAEGGISITAALDAALRFERAGTPVWTHSSIPPRGPTPEDTTPPQSGVAVRQPLSKGRG